MFFTQTLRQKLIKVIIAATMAILGVLALLSPTLAHAAPGDAAVSAPPNICAQFGSCADGLDTTGKTGTAAQSGIESFLLTITRIFTFFAAILAVIFIVIGGYYIVSNASGSRSLEMGREFIKNAVIGLVVIFLAQFIVEISIGVLKGAFGIN